MRDLLKFFERPEENIIPQKVRLNKDKDDKVPATLKVF